MTTKILTLGNILSRPISILIKQNNVTPNLKTNFSTSSVACVNFFNKCKLTVKFINNLSSYKTTH